MALVKPKSSVDEVLPSLQRLSDWPSGGTEISSANTLTAVSADVVNDSQNAFVQTLFQGEASMMEGAGVDMLPCSNYEDEVKSKDSVEVVEAAVANMGPIIEFLTESKDIPEPQCSASEEEDEPTVEVVQKAFDSMFELLKLDRSHESTASGQSFEKFAELLTDPKKLKEEREVLEESMEKVFFHNDAPLDDDLEIMDTSSFEAKASATTLPDVLPPSSSPVILSQTPPEDDAMPEPEDNLAIVCTSQNPAVEHPEGSVEPVVVDIPERLDTTTVSEAQSIKSDVSNELDVNKSSETKLLMPSALNDSHDMLTMIDEKTELEASSVQLLPSDNGKASHKVKKSKRKPKKGKKAEANVPVLAGGAEEG